MVTEIEGKSLEQIRRAIWDYPGTKTVFRNNTFPVLCFRMTCVAEAMFLSLLNPINMFQRGMNIGKDQDRIRHSYREALKWAYRFCQDQTSFLVPTVCLQDIEEIIDIFEEVDNFNLIRKAFDDYDIHRYSAEVAGEHEAFFRNKKLSRDMGASLYAHWVDNEKPEDQLDEEKNCAMSETARLMVDPQIGDTWKLYENKPLNRAMFNRYYQSTYKKVLSDAEEKENYFFDGFSLEHFQMVYAGLMALGLMRYHDMYLNSLPSNKKLNSYDKNRPIVYGSVVWLKSFLARSLKLDEEEVQRILIELTYEGEFHKDKITIVQPLFVFDKYFFFSPTIVHFSLQQDKLFFLYKEKKKNEQLISKIAHDRERIMTTQLIDEIQKNSKLICKTNYKIFEFEKCKAEFDLIIYDSNSNKILLSELKWFFKADGEFGHRSIDQRISKSVQLRKQREEIAKNHLCEIMKNLFPEVHFRELPEVMSCIVSKNYSGSSFIQDDIPIFDQFLFLQELGKTKYDLGLFFEDVKEKNYLPRIEDFGIEIIDVPVDFADYRVWIPGYQSVN